MRNSLILALLLAGCASEPVLTPVVLDKPVVEGCKIPVVKAPEWPTDSVRASDNTFIKVRAALAELKLRVAYEKELLAAQSKCN